jgi:hypothetical protein
MLVRCYHSESNTHTFICDLAICTLCMPSLLWCVCNVVVVHIQPGSDKLCSVHISVSHAYCHDVTLRTMQDISMKLHTLRRAYVTMQEHLKRIRQQEEEIDLESADEENADEESSEESSEEISAQLLASHIAPTRHALIEVCTEAMSSWTTNEEQWSRLAELAPRSSITLVAQLEHTQLLEACLRITNDATVSAILYSTTANTCTQKSLLILHCVCKCSAVATASVN